MLSVPWHSKHPHTKPSRAASKRPHLVSRYHVPIDEAGDESPRALRSVASDRLLGNDVPSRQGPPHY